MLGITTESVDSAVFSCYRSSQHGSTCKLTSRLSCFTQISHYLRSLAKSLVSFV